MQTLRRDAASLVRLIVVIAILAGTTRLLAQDVPPPPFGGSLLLNASPPCCCKEAERLHDTSNLVEQAADMLIDAFGDIVLVGKANDDWLVVKYDGRGSHQWTAPPVNGTASAVDEAFAVATDPCGHIYVTGRVINADEDIVTVKYSGLDGSMIWATTHGAGLGWGVDIETGADGAVFVLAQSGTAADDFSTLKYDATTGSLESGWPIDYDGGAADAAVALAMDPVGNPVVTGWASVPDPAFTTIKYDASTAAQLWLHQTTQSSLDYPYGIAIDCEGSVFVTGLSLGASGDAMTIKLEGDTGIELWTSLFDGSGGSFDSGSAVTIDSKGNVIVAGTSTSQTTHWDIATIKYDGDSGTQIWANLYAAPSYKDYAVDVTVDRHDDVYVAGVLTGATTDPIIATIKYTGVSGTEKWAHLRANYSTSSRIYVNDHTGCVYVSGRADWGAAVLLTYKAN